MANLNLKFPNISETESVSAGLDYPGVGPEHSFLKDTGRAEYFMVNDDDVINAFKYLTEKEGILPALESSHAIAYVIKNSDKLKGKNVVINLSGRGDKDMDTVFSYISGEKAVEGGMKNE